MPQFSQIAFILISFIVIASALCVVLFKELIYSALSMVGCFLGVAGLFVMLHAELVAAAQVLIYVGAISVLIIFAIMLTSHRTGDIRLYFHQQAWVAAFICAVAAVALVVVMATADYNSTTEAQNPGDEQIASLLFNEYAFPFELVSLALLVAMVGAVLLAKKEK
ncbi:MAG: NADH-quinone oxidoreductase subunit J family protein [Thermoleophilia bacterium]